jgi:DNA-binding ferritin-like protein
MMPAARRPSTAVPGTPADLPADAASAVAAAVNPLLADALALYLKTENLHWHERHAFRDYHLPFDEQGEQVATTRLLENFIDEAERRTLFLFQATRVSNQPQ